MNQLSFARAMLPNAPRLTATQILDKLEEELIEVRGAVAVLQKHTVNSPVEHKAFKRARRNLHEEIGDCLHTLSMLCDQFDVSFMYCVTGAEMKFKNRCALVESYMKQGVPFDTAWQYAKQREQTESKAVNADVSPNDFSDVNESVSIAQRMLLYVLLKMDPDLLSHQCMWGTQDGSLTRHCVNLLLRCGPDTIKSVHRADGGWAADMPYVIIRVRDKDVYIYGTSSAMNNLPEGI